MDPKIALGTLGALGASAYIYSNTALFHRGPNGLGSCSTIDDVTATLGLDLDTESPFGGKIAMVTGASSGLGFAVAVALVRLGFHVHSPCRTARTAMETKARIVAEVGKECTHFVTTGVVDIADVEMVKAYAKRYRAAHSELHVLVMSAGVMWVPDRRETKTGVEYTMGTCHLGHFALFKGLIEPLSKASGGSRVVVVASKLHSQCSDKSWVTDFGRPRGPTKALETEPYSATRSYANAKMANILFAREAHERFRRDGITVLSCHPGVVHSRLQRFFPVWKRFGLWMMTPFLCKSIPQGAATILYAAVHPTAGVQGGVYLEDCNPKVSPKQAWIEDESLRAELWRISENLIRDPDDLKNH